MIPCSLGIWRQPFWRSWLDPQIVFILIAVVTAGISAAAAAVVGVPGGRRVLVASAARRGVTAALRIPDATLASGSARVEAGRVGLADRIVGGVVVSVEQARVGALEDRIEGGEAAGRSVVFSGADVSLGASLGPVHGLGWKRRSAF